VIVGIVVVVVVVVVMTEARNGTFFMTMHWPLEWLRSAGEENLT
jgi:hypothetical protein